MQESYQSFRLEIESFQLFNVSKWNLPGFLNKTKSLKKQVQMDSLGRMPKIYAIQCYVV